MSKRAMVLLRKVWLAENRNAPWSPNKREAAAQRKRSWRNKKRWWNHLSSEGRAEVRALWKAANVEQA